MYANFLCTLSSITVAVRNIGVCAMFCLQRLFLLDVHVQIPVNPLNGSGNIPASTVTVASNRHRTLFYHNINPFIEQWQDCLPLVEKDPLTGRGKHTATKCHVLTGSGHVRPVLWTDSGNNIATRICIHRSVHYSVRCVNVPFNVTFFPIWFGRLWPLKC